MKLSTISSIANNIAIISLLAHILTPGIASAQTIDPLTVDLSTTTKTTTIAQTPDSALYSTPVVVEPTAVDLEPEPDEVFDRAEVSAYTSTPGQTDSDPFTAANGKRVHDGMIAANGFPFGTIVKIPEVYGDKEFIVEDRMNKRYTKGHFDVWLDTSRSEALKFGRKHVRVEIYYVKKEIAKQ